MGSSHTWPMAVSRWWGNHCAKAWFGVGSRFDQDRRHFENRRKRYERLGRLAGLLEQRAAIELSLIAVREAQQDQVAQQALTAQQQAPVQTGPAAMSVWTLPHGAVIAIAQSRNRTICPMAMRWWGTSVWSSESVAETGGVGQLDQTRRRSRPRSNRNRLPASYPRTRSLTRMRKSNPPQLSGSKTLTATLARETRRRLSPASFAPWATRPAAYMSEPGHQGCPV